GRDVISTHTDVSQLVSIRAPVKDATAAHFRNEGKATVSIRAPVKDATRGEKLSYSAAMFLSARP
ncbi:hypothetical protein, partial [Thalassolituus oleivorans]|uniref:hypothetical protein n=1 Tax=Thalassolituus oleivorans TaxID=187493 RepID=UPI003C6F0FB7